MALTSNDETDLILPLFRGIRERPRFSTFLERLRRRTGAEYVGLVFRQKGAPVDQETEFHAGIDLNRMVREAGIEDLHAIARAHHDRLRPGRVYGAQDFADLNPEYKTHRNSGVHGLGIGDERVVRIVGEDGLTALLIMARSRPCSAADSALLSNLAPYIGAAMANFVALEGQRVAAAMAAEGLGRSGVGWILFEGDARILSIDPATRAGLDQLAGITATPGERIRNAGTAVERDVAAAAAALAGDPDAPSRALLLSEDPRIEAVLTSANAVEFAGMLSPAMLAMCRLPRARSNDRADRLARLYDLPAREAELAIALSDGLSIAEAADELGLTVETARNYSKKLYAKLGVRGQAELVRRVYESGAVLA